MLPLPLLLAGLLAATPAEHPAPPPAVLRFSPRPNRASEIHWRAFGPEAFAEARRSGKPLFLNLAAVWCHWCHVLDETTLSDPQVIALLNARFIPMRVDADQNPQVERRYLLGGWPTTAFLDEQGEVLGGGTYIPSERFLALARTVVEGYGGDRAALRAKLGQSEPPPLEGVAPGTLEPALVLRIGAQIRGAIDPEHGGFGGAPKFPQGQAVALLGYLAGTRGDAEALAAARSTLLHMRQGEIFDPVEGGFFRYAMRADWSEPHYEKMLAVNAEILLALAETYAAKPDEELRGTAQSIASYLVSHLWDERAGAFYASQDADETYYRLDAAGRARRTPPAIDRTFLADRIGLTARALVRAAVVFEEPELARYAARSEELVLSRMRTSEGSVFHALSAAPNAKPAPPASLGDQAQTALALLDLASYTGEERYLRAAAEIVGACQRTLADPAGPGFFDVPPDAQAAGRVAAREKPFEENVELALAQLRLGQVSGNDALLAQGRATLSAFAGRAGGLGAAEFARAADLAMGQGLRLVVVGPADQAATRTLFRACVAFPDPRREVRLLKSNERGAHLGSLSFPPGAPAVYACAGTACSRPIRDVATLHEQLRAFIHERLR